MNKPELLAPAGDLERLKIAFLYGADACYVGYPGYSLRSQANFSLDDLKEGINIAHQLNKKIYVTFNLIFHNQELKNVVNDLKILNKLNVDGLIISDLGTVDLIKKNNLSFNIIGSTQLSILNKESANFLVDLGFSRVVLAREALVEDIKDIIKGSNIELETFIHGAMCTSFSGQCVLSNYCTLRDSNRGACAQVCRFLFDEGKNDLPFSIASKDLNMVSNIKKMMELNISSFKIEGRMRSIYYIATVVLCYRRIIDLIINDEINDEYLKYYENILNKCSNRESAPQFFSHETSEKDQYFLGRQEISNQDFLGIVIDYDIKRKIVTIEQRNYFSLNDEIEFFGPNNPTFKTIVKDLMDNNGTCIKNANHPQMIVKMKCDKRVYKGDMMRRKIIDK